MRRRALLLAFLAGALALAGGATLGTNATRWQDTALSTTALARAELADVPAPTALSRARDDLGQQQDTRRDVAAAVALGLALILAAGWWLARQRTARSHRPASFAARRTRGVPPRLPSIVHC